jgi:hypothetical protein
VHPVALPTFQDYLAQQIQSARVSPGGREGFCHGVPGVPMALSSVARLFRLGSLTSDLGGNGIPGRAGQQNMAAILRTLGAEIGHELVHAVWPNLPPRIKEALINHSTFPAQRPASCASGRAYMPCDRC